MIGTRSIAGRLAALAVLVVLFYTPSSLWASITTIGNIYPSPYPGLGDWLLAGSSLRIGDVNDGILSITGGYHVHVTSDTAYFGYGSGAEGVGTVTGTGSLLDAAYGVVVGREGVGILDVNNAGQVTDTYGLLGMLAGSTGTARVTDVGSAWSSTEALGVGGWGTGNLAIANGATVSAADVFIGGVPIDLVGGSDPNLMPNGTGTVTVSGTGSQLQVTGAASLYVGYYGTGALDVNDGALATTNLAVLGAGPDANGVVTVRDAGSTLDVSGATVVGAWGQGSLTVSNGGQVTTNDLYIGGFDTSGVSVDPNMLARWGDPNGIGHVTVTGAGSELSSGGSGTLYVGYSGQGALDILNGGRVESQAGVVGALSGSVGRVTVDGDGSTWAITGGALGADAYGDGDVIIANGGLVDVNGVGATLSVGDTITVGSDGQGTLLIANNAAVTSHAGVIGGYDPEYATLAEYFDPNATLGTGTGSATVTSGSVWYTQDLFVGFSHGGMLDVNDGEIYDSNAVLGLLPGAVGTATLTGPTSYWENSTLTVGGWGQGKLTVADGAYLYADEVFIGGMPLQVLGEDFDPNLIPNGPGKVTVTGAGSTLEMGGLTPLYVGFSGNGTLDVNEGGQVYADSAVLGVAPGVNGVVSVHDTDSYLGVDSDLLVGAWGRGELTVAEGGWVDTDTLTIGGFDVNEAMLDPNMVAAFGEPDGTGVVTVTGLNSYLAAPGGMVVGYAGQGTLNVLDAGWAETDLGVVGLLPGSQGYVLVDGNDSTWQTNTTVIGMYGQGSLTISNGGYVSNGDSYVGGYDPCALEPQYLSDWGEPNGTGTVLVTGTNSTWGNAGTLYLGYAGDGQMSVQAGGTVQDGLAILGFTPDSIGQAYVTGTNSTWQHDQDLVLGAWGIGTMSVTAGGVVTNQSAYVGGFDPTDFGYDPGTFGAAQGTGAVLVSGSGSLWTNTGDLLVGYYGTGMVDVNDGGHVTSSYGYIGYEEGSQGTVRVAGTGSIWDVANDLYVGGDSLSAGSGLLSVRDGGLVTVGGTLWVQPAGTLMGNGTIDAPLVDNYGIIAPGNSIGTLTVNGDVTFEPNSVLEVEISGDDTSDKLVATGAVDIVGGTVRPVSAGTIVGSHQYEIVEANSVTGTFDALDTALLNFYFNDIGMDYDPNSVWLWVDATRFDDPNIWRTNNEREVGEALQQIAEGGGTEITDALQDLADFNDIRHAYDQLAGQSRPPLAPVTVSATSKFLGTVTGRVQTLQTGLYAMSDSGLFAMSGPESGMDGGRVGQAPRRGQTFAVGRGSPTLSDRKWGVWGQGYGLFGDRETEEAGVPGYTYNMYGGSMGADYQLTETLLLGLVGGYSTGQVEFAGLRDNADITATHFGAYGSYAWEKCYVDAVATYVGLKYDTERFVDLLSERLTGSFDGTEVAAYVEAGYNWELAPNTHLQPLASVQYTHLSLDSYTESGGASALAFDSQTYDSIKGSLGARLTHTLVESADDFRADVQLRGRWVHEFGDDHSTVDATFINSPAAVFTVEDKAISRESAVLGAGLYADLNKQMRVYLDYDVRLNSDESINVFSAALQYRW